MSRWGGSGGSYTTSNDTVASAGVAQNDYFVRTNNIPGGWDGSDPVSTGFTVYHTYQFTDVTQPSINTTIGSSSSQITMPPLWTSGYDPSGHERRAFGERYGVNYNDDGWAYCLGYSWQVFSGQSGADITGQCAFNVGSIVNHPVGNGTTFDLTATWYVVLQNGNNLPAGSQARLTLTRQRMDDDGPEQDLTGDYNGFNVPVSSGGPDVRIELKSGRDGNAGDGPFFGCGVLITGTFDLPVKGLPVAVGAGKPTTIITS